VIFDSRTGNKAHPSGKGLSIKAGTTAWFYRIFGYTSKYRTMKHKWIIVFCFSSALWPLFGQDPVQNFIKEAKDFYTQKNYKQAQMSLQDAINELNTLMAAQLVTVLPDEINGLKADVDGTSTTNLGPMGGGTQITKTYKHPDRPEVKAEIQIISNSPMISAMSMAFSNPSMMGEGAKTVRVGSMRAILINEMTDYYMSDEQVKKIRSTQIQLPLNQTLVMIRTNGLATEQEELAFAAKLDYAKIKMVIGE
jgi:hypothetical protein